MGDNDDLATSLGRLLERIDMHINDENIECMIPLATTMYEDEGVNRDAFIKALLEALAELGLVFGTVHVIGIRGGLHQIWPPLHGRRRRRKPTLCQAAAMLRRQRLAQRRKRGEH